LKRDFNIQVGHYSVCHIPDDRQLPKECND